MLAKVISGAVYGVDAYPVEIEVNTSGGENLVIVIVGLPDVAVRESRDRVWTALTNSGFRPHTGRITVNLAPADVKKEGPRFDLPIALGMLAAQDKIFDEALKEIAVVGELALSGKVRRVNGILPFVLRMRDEGMTGIVLPVENAEEAAVVEGLDIYPVRSLREAADFLSGEFEIEPLEINRDALFEEGATYGVDFSDVKGQESARRAVEIAVAGGHNILCVGSPGTGKSMIAKRIPTILPAMSLDEALETTKIHSIAGVLDPHEALVARRPFRSPHHTISDAGLLGGGSYPVPGEVSLAHHGVLFLDELPEFKRNVLEVMRQPLEDGRVTISRATVSLTFPCRFMLVAAMNPCPCGFYGDPQRECRCTPTQISRYRSRVSGPLLDRIDLHVEVPAISYKELSSTEPGETSAAMRVRVVAARRVQQERFRTTAGVHCNASMRAREIQKYCGINEEARSMLKLAIQEMHFSARAYDRILKVARTIADLDGCDAIETGHIGEAIQLRSLDRQIW